MLGYYWKVDIPAMNGGYNQYSFNISSSIGESRNINNVLFGDVYLCSGQSNMQMGVPGILVT
jgi:sialate O-acetylesterase